MNTDWTKIIITALITVAISISGATYFTGNLNGKTEVKITNLEEKVSTIEIDKRSTENLLYRIDERLKNIENLVKELHDKK